MGFKRQYLLQECPTLDLEAPERTKIRRAVQCHEKIGLIFGEKRGWITPQILPIPAPWSWWGYFDTVVPPSSPSSGAELFSSGPLQIHRAPWPQMELQEALCLGQEAKRMAKCALGGGVRCVHVSVGGTASSSSGTGVNFGCMVEQQVASRHEIWWVLGVNCTLSWL